MGRELQAVGPRPHGERGGHDHGHAHGDGGRRQPVGRLFALDAVIDDVRPQPDSAVLMIVQRLMLDGDVQSAPCVSGAPSALTGNAWPSGTLPAALPRCKEKDPRRGLCALYGRPRGPQRGFCGEGSVSQARPPVSTTSPIWTQRSLRRRVRLTRPNSRTSRPNSMPSRRGGQRKPGRTRSAGMPGLISWAKACAGAGRGDLGGALPWGDGSRVTRLLDEKTPGYDRQDGPPWIRRR